MTDVLTGVLSGGGFGLTPYADPKRLDVSHSLTAIDIGWFMEEAAFRARVGELIDMVKSRAKRPGVDEILVPGEQEARRIAAKGRVGVPLEDKVLEDLVRLKGELGIAADLVVLGPYAGDRL